MKIITYKCNVCREEYASEKAIKEKLVKAIYFSNMHNFTIKELPAECDTHICVRCLDQLKNQL